MARAYHDRRCQHCTARCSYCASCGQRGPTCTRNAHTGNACPYFLTHFDLDALAEGRAHLHLDALAGWLRAEVPTTCDAGLPAMPLSRAMCGDVIPHVLLRLRWLRRQRLSGLRAAAPPALPTGERSAAEVAALRRIFAAEV